MAKNIFDFMRSFDRKDYDQYDKLTDAERTEMNKFVSYLSLRWMSGAKDDNEHLLALLDANEVNRTYFSLYKHPELQAKLMTRVGLGQATERHYVKGPTSKKSNMLYEVVRQMFSGVADEDCEMYLENVSRDAFLDMCRRTGHSPKSSKVESDKPTLEELAKLFDEYRK